MNSEWGAILSYVLDKGRAYNRMACGFSAALTVGLLNHVSLFRNHVGRVRKNPLAKREEKALLAALRPALTQRCTPHL